MDDEAKRKYNAEKTARSRAKKAADGEVDRLFNCWWKIYPKKLSKNPARTAWAKLAKDGVDLHEVLRATETLMEDQSYEPFHTAMQYVPYPGKWLNNHRYEEVQGNA